MSFSNICCCVRLPQNEWITIIKKSELIEIKASSKSKRKQHLKEEKGARKNREKDDEAAMGYERIVNDANTHVNLADPEGPIPPSEAQTDGRSALDKDEYVTHSEHNT